MKTCLILCIGCSLDPWQKMHETSINTWDSISVDGVDTIFYFGNPIRENTDKEIYFNIEESYFTMGEKMIQAFEYSLKNKSFDYIARVNSSCYVDKNKLIEYVQTLPDTNCFAGVEVESDPKWMWGGGQFILSKDVAESVVNHKNSWDHTVMEDVGLSYMINDLGIPYTKGKACSINKTENSWTLIGYGGDSIEFTDWNDVKPLSNHFYRCKVDLHREQDAVIMNNLYNVLK